MISLDSYRRTADAYRYGAPLRRARCAPLRARRRRKRRVPGLRDPARLGDRAAARQYSGVVGRFWGCPQRDHRRACLRGTGLRRSVIGAAPHDARPRGDPAGAGRHRRPARRIPAALSGRAPAACHLCADRAAYRLRSRRSQDDGGARQRRVRAQRPQGVCSAGRRRGLAAGLRLESRRGAGRRFPGAGRAPD